MFKSINSNSNHHFHHLSHSITNGRDCLVQSDALMPLETSSWSNHQRQSSTPLAIKSMVNQTGNDCIVSTADINNGDYKLLTSKITYYSLLLTLIAGITLLIIVPLGSTFLFIDYKQQLAQRKFNKSDLCKSKCLYGAECILDKYTEQAFCRCPLSCPDDYQPVCGSDGITYINQCHLKYESCNKQQIINITSLGTCDAALCQNVVCQRYQRCQVDENGRTECVCSTQSICNSSTTGKEPVCGSNGKLYNSECELQRHSCFYNIDIAIIDLSFCLKHLTNNNANLQSKYNEQNNNNNNNNQLANGGPRERENVDSGAISGTMCGNQICHRYAKCQTMSSGIGTTTIAVPKCQCPNNCTNEYSPICATNNQNYANECELRKDACLRQIELKTLHRGHCGQCDPKCQYYSKCQPNQLNIPECVCPQVCIRVDRPVCGDNGVTYENECELQVASCRLRKQINIQFNASCDLCHNIVCHYGATCFNGKCVCTDNCQNNLVEPLCANDGNTYRNECEMNKVACNSKKELIALFYGRCEETNENLFEEYAPLIQEDNHNHHVSAIRLVENSICNQMADTCHYEQQRINNGSDGYVYVCNNQIFKTKCDMLKYSCQNNPNEQFQCNKYCHCHQDGIQMDRTQICHENDQCICKPEMEGIRCDQCSPKYWNANKDANSKSIDCQPCDCNRMGSVNDECDGKRGRCQCKPGVRGKKCDKCPSGTHLTHQGCVHNSLLKGNSHVLHSCNHNHNQCRFGAICQKNGRCVCQFNCNELEHHHQLDKFICASDGSVHKSMCHFHQYSCNLQKKLQIVKHCPSLK